MFFKNDANIKTSPTELKINRARLTWHRPLINIFLSQWIK